MRVRSRFHLRLAELRSVLRQTSLGAHPLSLQRLNLPLRQIEVFHRSLYRGLLLAQLRSKLLGVLNAARAGVRQVLITGGLLLCKHQRCVRQSQLRLAGLDLGLLNRHLRLDRLHARPRLLNRGLSLTDRDRVVCRVDHHKQIALVHILVVDDRQLDNTPRNLRRHRDDQGAHGSVARPWRAHIDAPQSAAEKPGKRDRP